MRLLALTETADHVCGRYRVRAFEPALARAGWSLSIRGIARGVAGRLGQFRSARDYDAVLLQRKLLPDWQSAVLRRNARRLIFDFDDAVLYRDSYDQRGPHCPRRARRFRATIRSADLVIAGNAFLAGCAEHFSGGDARIEIIPTCVTPELYSTSDQSASPAQFILTWIGSSSTLRGLEVQRAAWERVGRELPDARLRLISDRFADFRPLRVEEVAWSEAAEAEELARAHVGIGWIPDDLWSRGKCGLKVLQYQAAGLPVVANPVGVHPEMIRDGETGFLARSPDEWLEAFRLLRADPSLRMAMGKTARAAIEDRYSVKARAPDFVRAVSGRRPPPPPRTLEIDRAAEPMSSTSRVVNS